MEFHYTLKHDTHVNCTPKTVNYDLYAETGTALD